LRSKTLCNEIDIKKIDFESIRSYTCIMNLEDITYNIEMNRSDTITSKQLVAVTDHLIRTLPHNSDIGGSYWEKATGICHWYKQEGYLSDKQRWLLLEIVKNNAGYIQFY